MPDSIRDCKYFEPLISALLDDELTPSELDDLNDHLSLCHGCSEQVGRFRSVNAAVLGLSDQVFGKGKPEPVASAGYPTPASSNAGFEGKQRINRTRQWPIWSMVPLTVVATVAICLFLIALPNGEPASADQVSPAQVVEPIRELHLIHSQQQRDQKLMLSTLGMDLRSLKLELNRLEKGSPEREALSQQIDAMLEKVQLFSASNTE